MPIKPFSLSGGGGIGCVVGRWNGSRNLPDGGGKNGDAGGGPNSGHGVWSLHDVPAGKFSSFFSFFW